MLPSGKYLDWTKHCGMRPAGLLVPRGRPSAEHIAPASTCGASAKHLGCVSSIRAATVVAVEMHAGQVTVAPAAVRALVDSQFPQWQGLPITPVSAGGTVNAIFRIGQE